MKMRVDMDGFGVLLRPFNKEDIPLVAEGFSSLKVHLYTNQLFAQVLENEIDWYENTRKDKSSCTWAIVPNGEEKIVGVTGLHKIDALTSSCTSGIIIFRPDWWGKGIATRTHLARTLFVSDFLKLGMIRSGVRLPNEASRRALERIGYKIWGTEPFSVFREGKWLSTHHMVWINPLWTSVYFPDGVEEEFNESISVAKSALKKAREVVSFP